MGKINAANMKKTYYYLKRNGLKASWYAAMERLQERNTAGYCFQAPSEETLRRQREQGKEFSAAFSIVVPAYRTKETYFREMADSLLEQSYPKWELIIADATEDDSVERVARTYGDERIRYIRLPANEGIAENTNQALQYISMEYAGLLDHDDVLTPDALFEMAAQIEERKKAGIKVQMLYSDEDKCDGERTTYYEPHYKEDFNLDLLLSNNYICHFLVLESSLIKSLKFGKEYDGAQDFDLVLRAAESILKSGAGAAETALQCGTRASESTVAVCGSAARQIVHIPKVLYHWRCHEASTAQNPQSKAYAYRAGKRAVQAFADRQGWKAQASDLPHLGFYALRYQDGVLAARRDVGAVGGKLLKKGRIAGGRYLADGTLLYEGLPASYSGYLHRAALQQDADAVDIRLIEVRRECRKLFEQVTGVPYQTLPGQEVFDASTLPEDMDYQAVSIAFGKALREAGYRILWTPAWSGKWR